MGSALVGSPPAHPSGAAPDARRVPGTAAVLLIHGIGEQRPYETIDSFVQGLAQDLNIAPSRLEHRLSLCGDRVTTSIRIPGDKPIGRFGTRTLDVYEFHWAGLVEGKIRLHQVLWWLMRTALTPLRLWSYQATLPAEAGTGQGPSLRFLLGEVWRSAGLLLLALIIVLPFAAAILGWRTLIDALSGLWSLVHSLRPPGAWGVLAVVLAMIGSIVLGYGRLTRWLRSPVVPDRVAIERWKWSSVVTLLALGTVAILIQRMFRLDLVGLLEGIWEIVRLPPVALVLILGVVAWMLAGVLVRYVGDIALYTTADENSSFFRTRTRILESATKMLQSLCGDPGYEGVYLAGHSLGSVIAYDSINRAVCEARVVPERGEAVSAVARIRGLLTFGSPLDTVYYFFRTVVKPGEPVRAQILSSLHAFRKQPSGRDYGPFQFAHYELPTMDEFVWLNVFSPRDQVSRRLAFYKVDRQESRPYGFGPVGAHLAYWTDPEFYRLVSEWL